MHEDIERIKIVKRKYVKQWLKIDGVIAVGIGFMKNKETGIIVSIKKLSLPIQKFVPNEIDGVPIELNVTGEIKAL